MAKKVSGTGNAQRPTPGPQPKQVSNRLLNHRRFPQYPRSKGPGDIDVTFGVNIPMPASNPMSDRTGSTANTQPRISSGSVPSSTNKYRDNK